MSKNPNRSPEKGFISEIAKAPKPAPIKKPGFEWGKSLSGGQPSAEPMNVPRRLTEMKPAAKPKSNIAAEAAQIIAKRRGY